MRQAKVRFTVFRIVRQNLGFAAHLLFMLDVLPKLFQDSMRLITFGGGCVIIVFILMLS